MKLICVLSIVLALGATPAFADDPPKYEPKIIPKCSLAGDVCGYTLGEWQLALKVDAELVSKRVLLAKEQARAEALALQVAALKDQTSVYASSQKALVDYSVRCTQARIDLDLKYQKERVKPRLGSPLAWTVTAVSASILAGFVVRDLVK